MRTTGANWPSTSARVRTSSAYLAAYLGRIAHSACVTIVREALRETGPALPARATHFVDTHYARKGLQALMLPFVTAVQEWATVLLGGCHDP